MNKIVFRLALLAGVYSYALLPAAGQSVSHPDSVRAAAPAGHYKAVFIFNGGKRVPAYILGLEQCYVDRIECYERRPDEVPAPQLKALSVERLEGMESEGHTYESLRLNGKPIGVLAENRMATGPMQLFGYIKTKSNMPIPIPLPGAVVMIPTGTHDKYFWYVRLATGKLQEVERGDAAFARQMATLCAAAPQLSEQIGKQAKGFGFENVEALVRQYNETVAGK
ncbi:hypothetical protein LJY25_05320 [Hymenobacter sp. BT175]|uniref:hypothetical protein n=1 Tax=Hymenobacter translucens TaxID=2886507 RepID=UPI001D0E649A|nr:hypothetical protein [Hymenobacter translucens]MCC2545855.1 hypothetical protein [Hymenobacter translucens]